MTAGVPAAVSRACTALVGAPAITASRLSARSRTAVYRAGLVDGRSVVVKLYAATALRNAITESAAIRAVADHVPVPAVLGYGHIPGHEATALITTDLGPLTLGSAMRSGRISEERALKDLAGLLGRLHRASARSGRLHHGGRPRRRDRPLRQALLPDGGADVLIIALEGPSYAGKSTAIRHLRHTSLGSRAFVSDCYVKHIAHRDDIPPARTDSSAPQLAAFERFMEIEATRVAEAAVSGRQLVILDRSVDTLLAHAYALDALFGYGVHHQLRHRLPALPFLRPHRARSTSTYRPKPSRPAAHRRRRPYVARLPRRPARRQHRARRPQRRPPPGRLHRRRSRPPRIRRRPDPRHEPTPSSTLRARTVTDAYPLALDHHLLAAWAVFPHHALLGPFLPGRRPRPVGPPAWTTSADGPRASSATRPGEPVTRELTVLAADAGPDDIAQAVEALVTFWAR
ncbi:hypothetical protein SNARM312S_04699 [Streptomyces narbonensis]